MTTSYKNLVKAKYMIALSKNEITDEIRSEYIDNIISDTNNAFEHALDAYLSLFEPVAILLKNGVDLNTVKNTFEYEYNSLGINEYIGEYAAYKEFTDFLMDICHTGPILGPAKRVELVKTFININCSDLISNSVKWYCLNMLVTFNDTLVDIPLTQSLIDTISSIEVTDNMKKIQQCIDFIISRRVAF